MQEDVLKDERVQEILEGLTRGKTREQLAEEFQHTTYKTLDIYMRRRGFEWDREKQNYRLAAQSTKTKVVDTSKVHRIVQLIEQQEKLDLEKIAHLMKFIDYKSMALYMKDHQYIWSQEKGNYIKQSKNTSSDEVQKSLSGLSTNSNAITVETLTEYESLLMMLKTHEKKLVEILQPYSSGGNIPRYTIKGVGKTKTVQMVHSLDQLVVEFATEHNMTQRDVFEVALIDFFKKYGYEKQTEQLF